MPNSGNRTDFSRLNQWNLEDELQMEDFNRDNNIIDQALHDLTDEKVDKSTLVDINNAILALSESKVNLSDIDGINDDIQELFGTKANRSEVDTMNNAVQELSTEKADKSDLDGIRGDIQTLNSSKAEQADLQNLAGEIGLHIADTTLFLPKVIYATIGNPIELYGSQVFRALNSGDYEVYFRSSQGRNSRRKWSFTPQAEHLPSVTVTAQVRNSGGKLIATGETTIMISPALPEVPAKTLMMIGDSISTDTSSPDLYAGIREYSRVWANTQVDVIQMVGTKGTAPHNHEATSGSAIQDFLTDCPANPFWNVDTGRTDFASYTQRTGITPDMVHVMLGTNNARHIDSEDSDQIEADADNIIQILQYLRQDWPDTRLLVGLIPFMANQDAAEEYRQFAYDKSTQLYATTLYHKITETFGARDAIRVIPYTVLLDREYGYGQRTVKANPFSDVDICIPADAIHPCQAGQRQMARALVDAWADVLAGKPIALPPYTATYHVNDGTSMAVAESDATTVKSAADLEFSYVGHVFSGWNEWSDGTGMEFHIGDLLTDDVVLYAQWKAIDYTVTFHSDGGSLVDSQEVPYGNKVTKPDDPTRENHSFGGWYRDAAFTTLWDSDTDCVWSNITLYAKWNPPIITVTYMDGDVVFTTQTYDLGALLAMPKPAPTKIAHVMDGWYPENDNIWNFKTNKVEKDMVLHATYIPMGRYIISNTNRIELPAGTELSFAEIPSQLNIKITSGTAPITQPLTVTSFDYKNVDFSVPGDYKINYVVTWIDNSGLLQKTMHGNTVIAILPDAYSANKATDL